MATIIRPLKTLGNREYQQEFAAGQTFIKDTEVDADLDTIVAAANNLDNSNILTGPGTPIATSKLAQDHGIGLGHIVVNGLNASAIAGGTVTNNKNFGYAVNNTLITLNASYQNLATVVMNAQLHTTSSVLLVFCKVNVSLVGGNLCDFQVLHGAGLIAEGVAQNDAANSVVRIPIVLVGIDVPTVLSPTYTVQGLDQSGSAIVNMTEIRLVELI